MQKTLLRKVLSVLNKKMKVTGTGRDFFHFFLRRKLLSVHTIFLTQLSVNFYGQAFDILSSFVSSSKIDYFVEKD